MRGQRRLHSARKIHWGIQKPRRSFAGRKMGDQRSSNRGRPDYRSRGGVRNALRSLPRNSRFWEKLQDHVDRRSHHRGRQDKAILSSGGLGGRDAAAFWGHLTTAAQRRVTSTFCASGGK